MTRLFISYRRKSWPFTHRLAEELGRWLDAEIFVDFSGIDEADFERAILRNLRASDAVLLVVSEHTFADRIHNDGDWVRREIREALERGKPLIPVCIDGLLPPSHGLPDDIQAVAKMQAINFYPEYFAAAVERLAQFIETIGAASLRAEPAASEPAPDDKQIGGVTTLDEALDVLDSGDFHKAIFLLESLVEAGFKSRYVNIAGVLDRTRADAAAADRRREAADAYAEIAVFARRSITEDQARIAFEAWRADYADLVNDLDSENLRARFAPSPPESTSQPDSPSPWLSTSDGLGGGFTGLLEALDTENLQERFTSSAAAPPSLSSSAFDGVSSSFTDLVEALDTEDLQERFKPVAPDSPSPTLRRSALDKGSGGEVRRVEDILPPPFAWCDIPAGRVELEDGHGWFDVAAFQIAKYPITNAQYRVFVEAGGYRERQWWTDAGWKMRIEGWAWNSTHNQWEPTGKPWMEPLDWQDARLNGAEYPVVGVSWFETVAFCQWLSELSGESVMLPTEMQWQRAAQGDDGRTYPWGNKWDGRRCRNSAGIRFLTAPGTSPVRQFEGLGDSPFGVVDMAGNIQEWCLNRYDDPKTSDLLGSGWRVLRGGGRYSSRNSTRCAYRTWRNSETRSAFNGFRVARTPHLS